MGDLVKKVKKEFLKIFGAGVLGLSLVGCADEVKDKKYVEDPRYEKECRVVDANINDVDYRMVGVYHTGFFMDEYFNVFDEYIKNCSIVVTECGPNEVNRVDCSEDARQFFGTVLDLAKKHDKKVVTLDSLNWDMVFMEWYQSLAAGLALPITVLFLTYAQRKPKKSKRYMFGGISALALGTYLTLSSLPCSIIRWKSFDPDFENTYCFYNGIEDQRNIEITKRISKLDKLIPKEKLEQGEYVLAIFGNCHAKGFDFYTDHPYFKEFKSALYIPTYNLIDSDKISVWDYKNGLWWEDILEK